MGALKRGRERQSEDKDYHRNCGRDIRHHCLDEHHQTTMTLLNFGVAASDPCEHLTANGKMEEARMGGEPAEANRTGA